MTRRVLAVALALALVPAALQAQLGEMHLGALVSYGTADSYRVGGGLIGGVSVGRLVYVGARYLYYAGGTQRQSDSLGGRYDVTTRAQVFAADVGLQYPAGAVELVAGLTIGAAHYGQQTNPLASGQTVDTTNEGTEFLIAPNLSVQIRTLGLLVIPEVMYPLSGWSPNLRSVDHRGMVFAIRLVVPLEVARIRR